MTVATTKRILDTIACPELRLYKDRRSSYFYFVYDSKSPNIWESRSVWVSNLSDLSLESWVHEGRELVRRCKLMLGTSHVARLANPPMVRGL